jgi:glutaredoxin
VEELGLNEKVEYLTGEEGIEKIIEMGIMQSPVLVIDGKPVMVGFNPDIEEIKKLIKKSNE